MHGCIYLPGVAACPLVPAPTSPPTPSVGAEEMGIMELEAWDKKEDAPSCLRNVRLLGCRREGLDQAVLGIPVPEGSKLDRTLPTLRTPHFLSELLQLTEHPPGFSALSPG